MKVHVSTPKHHPCSEYQTLIRKLRITLNESLTLLRDLADLQNGPPLERDREEWEKTMKEVYDFLNEHEK